MTYTGQRRSPVPLPKNLRLGLVGQEEWDKVVMVVVEPPQKEGMKFLKLILLQVRVVLLTTDLPPHPHFHSSH